MNSVPDRNSDASQLTYRCQGSRRQKRRGCYQKEDAEFPSGRVITIQKAKARTNDQREDEQDRESTDDTHWEPSLCLNPLQ
jgi:hypothetical protein